MALLENCIGFGLLADRPAAGAPGALYFAFDTGQGFRDNGTTWDAISTSGAGRLIFDATGSALVTGPGELINAPSGG